MSSEPVPIAPTQGTRLRTGRRLNSPRLLQRAAIGICGGVFIGLLYAFLSSIISGHIKVGESGFLVYYSVSHLILQGHGAHIYDLATIAGVEHKPLSGMSPYLYPPYFAVLIAPTSLVGYNLAFALWLILSCAALGWVLLVLQRYAGLAGADRVLFWVATLSSFATFIALSQGQVSPLLLLLLTAALFAARSERDEMVGVLLGLTLIKPQYAFAFLLVFLLRLRRRMLVAFTVTAAVLVVLPIPVLGLSVDRGFVDTIRDSSNWHITGFSAQWNQCFSGFARLLLPGTAGTLLSLLLSLVALVLLGYVALRAGSIDLPFGLAVIVALLISPHTLLHDLVLLLIPIAVALRYRSSGPPGLFTLLATSYVAITVGFSLSKVIPVQLSVIAMSALGVWLVMAFRRTPQSDAPAGFSPAAGGMS